MVTSDDIRVSETRPAARPRIQRIEAIVNAASGNVGPGAAEALAQLIAAHGYACKLATPSPAELNAAIASAVDAAPDLLVILGGDGTAREAAERCGPDGPLLAALPGGTLNLLPHILYGALSWREALEAALSEGVERPICGGRVEGRSFYVAAILGAPALWGAAREAVRAGKIRQAWRRGVYALRRSFTGRVHYRIDGLPRREAEALVLISPTMSKAVGAGSCLEVVELDVHNAIEMFRLAFNGLVGDWRCDPGVSVHAAVHGRAAARRPIPCILDGELLRVGRSAKFDFQPRAFRALALPGGGGPLL
ncbi:MAG TPA: diacylglycerol kinase family protein [Caulobacteraceae bacterium]|nr:diacylglycerol kinase family protein [Caulobacteraceae bacterium]